MKEICYNTRNGALAQLGAHNTGSVGVRGSNPLCSTKGIRGAGGHPLFLWWSVAALRNHVRAVCAAANLCFCLQNDGIMASNKFAPKILLRKVNERRI